MLIYCVLCLGMGVWLVTLTGNFLLQVHSKRPAWCWFPLVWVWITQMAWFCWVWWCEWKSAHIFCTRPVLFIFSFYVFWVICVMLFKWRFAIVKNLEGFLLCLWRSHGILLGLKMWSVGVVVTGYTRCLTWKTTPCCIPSLMRMFRKSRSG